MKTVGMSKISLPLEGKILLPALNGQRSMGIFGCQDARDPPISLALAAAGAFVNN